MKNFDYLQDIPELATLHKFCDDAECTHNTNTDVCALNCRRALEWMVRAIYQMKHIEVDDKDSLYTLMSSQPFTEFLDDSRLMMAAHFVRKVGNKAAHMGGVKGSESFFCLLNLYNFIGGGIAEAWCVEDISTV